MKKNSPTGKLEKSQPVVQGVPSSNSTKQPGTGPAPKPAYLNLQDTYAAIEKVGECLGEGWAVNKEITQRRLYHTSGRTLSFDISSWAGQYKTVPVNAISWPAVSYIDISGVEKIKSTNPSLIGEGCPVSVNVDITDEPKVVANRIRKYLLKEYERIWDLLVNHGSKVQRYQEGLSANWKHLCIMVGRPWGLNDFTIETEFGVLNVRRSNPVYKDGQEPIVDLIMTLNKIPSTKIMKCLQLLKAKVKPAAVPVEKAFTPVSVKMVDTTPDEDDDF